MSEKLLTHHEQVEQLRPAQEDKLKPSETPTEEHHIKAHPHNLEKLRSTVAHEAVSTNEEIRPQIDSSHKETNIRTSIDRELKTQTLYRTLKNLRTHLPASSRLLSKLVHQPTVDRVSEIGSKTVARPSGILGGGVFAFLGSLLFIYYSKRVGFKYNYLAVGLFFFGGFLVGLVFEFIIRLIARRQQS